MITNHTDRDSFGRELNSVVSPSQPIQTIEQLFGREKELDKIEKALFAPGRHIFIYGDRGVGKSSLAATAATQYQSVDAPYLDVSCAPDTTLNALVANIAYKALEISFVNNTSRNNRLLVDCRYLKYEKSASVTAKDLHKEIHSLSDAVEVLREVALLHSEKPIVVLDEFDRIASSVERNLFADLLKHLGDKKVPLKFIFTGVGVALEELLGAHHSAIRQLETIELPKLGWEGRWEIVLNAARIFRIEVPKDIYVRIAAVSDGYPYYVHLITEKLLWNIFDDPVAVTKVTWGHYHGALHEAIDSISAELKRPYETAVRQRSGDYEEVIWATADDDQLYRYLGDMYDSYQSVMKEAQKLDPLKRPLDYEKFCSRIRSLRSHTCGSVLVSENNKGLYSYREKMLRGYVRMQAEAHGVRLMGGSAKPTEKQYMHVPARLSTGYRHPSFPKGVTSGQPHDDEESS